MTRRFLFLLALLLAVAWAPLAHSESSAHSYTLVRVGGDGGSAEGLNDAGDVVGRLSWGEQTRAFLWRSGVLTDLGDLGESGGLGGLSAGASEINNQGLVVGWSETADGLLQAFVWDSLNGMRGLTDLGGGWNMAEAINNAGQIVGVGRNADWADRAVLWQDGLAHDLGVLPGFVSSAASAINDSGQVVGYLTDADGGFRAFRWTPHVPNGTAGAMELLEPATDNNSYGINGAGDAVGYTLSPEGAVALSVVWDAAGATTLPALQGTLGGSAFAINQSRSVVGYSYGDDGGVGFLRAFVWDAVNGTRDLNVLANRSITVPPLESATDINVSGQIIANAQDGNSYLLTPSSLPAAPHGLAAVAEPTRVVLSWSESVGAETYTVRRSNTSGGPYSAVASVGGTTFTDTSVSSNATYFYVVTAVNSSGESAPSNEVVSSIPPAAPTNLTASSAKAKRRIDLKWTQSVSAGVNRNRIYRSTSPGAGFSLLVTIKAGTTYADTSVTSGGTYYYSVTALSTSGRESPRSNETSAKAR